MSLHIHRFFRLAVLLTLPCAMLFSQNLDTIEESEESSIDSAYLASQQAAHWSAYVPIAVIVGATVFFGVADQSHQSSSSSHSGSKSLEKHSSFGRSTSRSSYTCRGCYRHQASSHH